MQLNIIGGVILIALIADVVISAIADWLNIRRISDNLPQAFQNMYDARRYRRSQQYLRINTRFGWVVSAFDLTVLLIFWFAHGFAGLDHWLRSFGWGPIVTGLVYIGILVGAKSLLSLPFSIYQTFVIEQRFGFNQTRWSTFVTDLIKTTALGIAIGAPVLAAVLAFFEYSGNHAWWLCWAALTVLTLALQYVIPTWIMPLFNRFVALEDGETKRAIVNYARAIDFPLTNIFVMDGSRRSSKANAFFTGFGRNKRIVLYDTLIKNHSTDELVAILAHEMGHYKKRHIQLSMLLITLHNGAMLYLLSLFVSVKALFAAFYVDTPSVYAGLVFFGLLYAPIEMLLSIGLQAFSRHNEFSADRFAAQTTGQPQSLAMALKKLSVQNLSNLTPHPMHVVLHDSHPPVLDRLAALEAA